MLSSIGVYVFWTQLGFGIFLMLGLAIAVGLLLWYRARVRVLQSSTIPAEKGDSEPEQNVEPTMNQEPQSDPPLDLNAAWNNADSKSLYDNPPNDSNPFDGWNSCSSFKPVVPHKAVPEMHCMIQRPVAMRDKATMTSETQVALATLERNAIQAKQGRARWTESTEQLQMVQEQLLSATLSHLEQAGYYTRPCRHLPPQTPLRMSSLRGPSSSRRNKRNRQEQQEQRSEHHSADGLQTEQTTL